MHAVAAISGRGPVQLELSFEDFLYSGVMRRQAQVAMCSPDDLIVDHLPAFDCGDADEVREAFAEACEQASDCAVSGVKLDDDDLLFTRRHFIESRPFRLLIGDPPLAA